VFNDLAHSIRIPLQARGAPTNDTGVGVGVGVDQFEQPPGGSRRSRPCYFSRSSRPVTATLELLYDETRETAIDPEWLVELNRVDTVNQLRSLKQPGRVAGEELSYQPVLSRIQSGGVRAHQNTRMRPESTLGR